MTPHEATAIITNLRGLFGGHPNRRGAKLG
jgi:hypothetical protein